MRFTSIFRSTTLRRICRPTGNDKTKICFTQSKLIHTVERGAQNSTSYKVFIKNDAGKVISPFHDIPLFADKKNMLYNMVVEIPRWSNAKMEIATKESLNPIIQDTKDGKPRFCPNIFPYKGYIWNYGALPQTWENPDHIDPETKCKGDNDPIDVCEIGSKVLKVGDVVQIKVLGILGMIDQGEMDWKVIGLNTADPLFNLIEHIDDIEMILLGYLNATREWFRVYKVPNKKPPNNFSYKGEYQDQNFANNIISEGHMFWQDLIKKNYQHSLSIINTTLTDSAHCITDKEAIDIVEKCKPPQIAEPVDAEHEAWHFFN